MIISNSSERCQYVFRKIGPVVIIPFISIIMQKNKTLKIYESF